MPLLIILFLLTLAAGFTALLLLVTSVASLCEGLRPKWPHKEDTQEYRSTFWKSYFTKALLGQLPILWIVFLVSLLTAILGLLWCSLVQPKLWLPFLDWLIPYLSKILEA